MSPSKRSADPELRAVLVETVREIGEPFLALTNRDLLERIRAILKQTAAPEH